MKKMKLIIQRKDPKMLQSKFNSPFIKSMSVLVLVIMLMAGCPKSPLESTDDQQPPTLLQRSDAFKASAQFSSSDLFVEQVISTSEGGRLELLDVILDVPAGAVGNDTVFSINIPDLNVFYNEFGTSGLVFDKPVKVTMSYRDADLTGVNETSIRIAWLNEATGEFEDLACEVDTVNKLITAELEHFSAYGLISDRTPTLP
jgi:hypothetical protein